MRARLFPSLTLPLLLIACGSGGGTATGGQGGSASSSSSSGGGASPTTSSSSSGSTSSSSTTSASSGTGGQSGAGHFVHFTNSCGEVIWVGALNAAQYPLPENGGFKLDPGETHTITLPDEWGGRFWGRSGCVFDQNGNGKCDSGDCGGKAQCNGNGGKPPATLFEITFGGFGGKDFYDISLVDGFNLPMAARPRTGTFTKGDPNDAYDCGAPACSGNANDACPAELAVKNAADKIVGCRSAHEACTQANPAAALDCAQNDDLYRCSGGGPNDVQGSCYSPNATASCCGCPAWSPPGACKATNPKWTLPSAPEKYAKVFKDACPSAYSFPYDDVTSTFTCKGDDYDITFCP